MTSSQGFAFCYIYASYPATRQNTARVEGTRAECREDDTCLVSALMSHAEMRFASSVGGLSSPAVAPRRARVATRGFRRCHARGTGRGARVVRVHAAFVPSGVTLPDLKEKGGRAVVELGGGKILIQEFMNDLYAVSNKCPHLGLSMQGKTALLSADLRGRRVHRVPRARQRVRPAHGHAGGGVVSRPADAAAGGQAPGGNPRAAPDVRRARRGRGMIEVDVDAPRAFESAGADASAETAAAGASSLRPAPSRAAAARTLACSAVRARGAA